MSCRPLGKIPIQVPQACCHQHQTKFSVFLLLRFGQLLAAGLRMRQVDIDKFVLQALNSSISRDRHLIGKVCNALGFIELPFVRHCPRSSCRQDNHALFVRADRPVLTSMPLLFARAMCRLSLRVFRTLPRTLCAIDDHLLHLWQSLDESAMRLSLRTGSPCFAPKVVRPQGRLAPPTRSTLAFC